MQLRQKFIFLRLGKKGLGTIGVRHGGYHVVHKVIVRRVVSHSKPASFPFNVCFLFMYGYFFVSRNPLTPECLWHCMGSGNTFPVFVPHRGFIWFFVSGSVTGYWVVGLFMPADGARPKKNQKKPSGLHLSA